MSRGQVSAHNRAAHPATEVSCLRCVVTHAQRLREQLGSTPAYLCGVFNKLVFTQSNSVVPERRSHVAFAGQRRRQLRAAGRLVCQYREASNRPTPHSQFFLAGVLFLPPLAFLSAGHTKIIHLLLPCAEMDVEELRGVLVRVECCAGPPSVACSA